MPSYHSGQAAYTTSLTSLRLLEAMARAAGLHNIPWGERTRELYTPRTVRGIRQEIWASRARCARQTVSRLSLEELEAAGFVRVRRGYDKHRERRAVNEITLTWAGAVAYWRRGSSVLLTRQEAMTFERLGGQPIRRRRTWRPPVKEAREVGELLERALARRPRAPGLCHLDVAVKASCSERVITGARESPAVLAARARLKNPRRNDSS